MVSVLWGGALPAVAQSDSDNSYIVDLIESGLSSEDRQIKLHGIEGLLASEATVQSITIADKTGVWLTVRNAKIVWSRLALIRGRLQIDELTAEAIEVVRKPVAAANALPSPEARSFTVPELPLTVNVGALTVGRISLAREIMGQAAEISVTGRAALEGGGLDLDLAVARLDVPEARIAVAVQYAPGGTDVAVDISAQEPEGGLVASLLGVPGEPALDLSLRGSGPVTDLELVLDLKANKLRQVEGTIRLDDAPGGLAFDVDMTGRLAFLVTGEMRPFFKGESTLNIVGRQLPGGGMELSDLAIATASLSLGGNFATTPDGFLRRAALKGQLGDGVSQTVLPFANGAASVRELRLVLNYGDAGADVWDGAIVGNALIAGDLSAAEFGLDLGGVAQNLDQPEARLVTLTAEGGFQGLRGATPDLSRALGQALDVTLATKWQAGKPFAIDVARIEGNGTQIDLKGVLEKLSFKGDARVEIARLTPFAGLVGRDLKGGLSLAVDGSVTPLTGAFDLGIKGQSSQLKLDMGQADRLLAGETQLSGRVSRDENGFRTDDLRLSNDQMDLRSNGFLASDKADLSFRVVLNELADLTKSASGAVRFEGTARGTDGRIALNSAIIAEDAVVLDRPLTGLRAGFTGTLEDGALDGLLTGRGRFGEGAIALVGKLAASGQSQSITDLVFRVGPSSITGSVARDADGLLSGSVGIETPDVSDLAALALVEATGTVAANLTFLPNDLGQQITARGRLGDLVIPQAQIKTADMRLIVQNAFGVPGVIGAVDFRNARVGGVAIQRGRASAALEGPSTAFDAQMDLENGTEIGLNGTLTALEDGYELVLARLGLDGAGPGISLANPASLRVRGASVEIETLDLAVGDGTIAARGQIDENFDLALDLRDVPLAIGNAVVDDLGAEGLVSATARVTGAVSDPQIAFEGQARAISTRLLREADLPPFDLMASGESADRGMEVAADLDGPGNFSANLAGYLPFDRGQMDLTGGLSRFPLALVDALAGQPGLRGTVDGTFGVAGRLTKPRLRFDLSANDVSARLARQNGIAPVSAVAQGSFANDTIILPDARITGGGGMDFRISGRIPLLLDGLDVAASGSVPLRIANVALARSGIQTQGTATMDMRATGRLAVPVLSGTARVDGATVTASRLNLRLEDLNADLDLSADRVTVRSLNARGNRGGTLSASGFVSASTRNGLPVDIRLSLAQFDYSDARLIATTIDGDLNLTGTLMRRPLLRGNLGLSPLEITIPNRLPQSTGFSIDVRHINTPAQVAETLRRARTVQTTDEDTGSDGAVELDITVNAPNRVFVRGRGLDAELGGQVRVTGRLPNYKPNGRFELVRGRLALLGQRINLTSGAIILTGTRIPDLQMEARVVTDEMEATFFMEGPASGPDLRFTSVPDLPDDEILARVLFGRAISELSALQVARLAAAVGELSGRTGGGVFEKIRQATGLDDLDFQTAEDGTTSLQVGKYIQENVYSTIEADNLGNSKATINLDINDNVTARGSVGSDGNTTIGIFFEKDY